ncbi:MAG: tRNA (adenosine(37)-N6)-dimethylallyltransferase MiaA [Lachnospiraceae bacterium]|jgi:tRNA dimethylallyltransferase|nr:tRNA (adenosine(37)-N6)-dimethylallyltransferase MiaA [Lachnospiraceae bacterium]
MNKQPLLILAGPTASGKTSLSLQLARRLNGEIISADSMQVYRGMDIGTAKITPAEMDGIPHHLIDIREPDEEWNVMSFCRLAAEKIEEIASRGRLPMVVGGTGFYIHALAYGAEFEEEAENESRKRLEGWTQEALFAYLQKVDPKSAQTIHPHNRKRIIRALEYFEQTGKPISELNARLQAKPSPYRLCYLVLDVERQRLYEQIDARVEEMLQRGLVQEVTRLKQAGCHKEMVSMKGLGYKEILAYLEGEISLEEAVYILKRDTRHFAKRQLTWMRREKEAVFLPKEPQNTLLDRACQLIDSML